MYVIFTDQKAFETWHEQWKIDHHYPIQGRNAATGKLVDIGWTTQYTDSKCHPEKDDKRVICTIKSADAAVIPGASEPDATEKEEWQLSPDELKSEIIG